MSYYKINIESIDPEIKINKRKIKFLAKTVLIREGVSQAEVNIILVDDNYIIKLNREFLNKNATTDVISFNLEDEPDAQLEGEIYANLEQIKRQSNDYQFTFRNELYRVIIHGLIHLVGFDDQTIEEKKIMTEKEDYYLTILENIL